MAQRPRRGLQDLRSGSIAVETTQELISAVASGITHIVITEHLNFTGPVSSDAPVLDILSQTESIQVCIPNSRKHKPEQQRGRP